MTASMAWPNFHREMEREVENQVAAPTETRTPNLHRANKIAHSRVRMEGWRQWRLGWAKQNDSPKPRRIDLTPTGLLMEGRYTQNPCFGNGE